MFDLKYRRTLLEYEIVLRWNLELKIVRANKKLVQEKGGASISVNAGCINRLKFLQANRLAMLLTDEPEQAIYLNWSDHRSQSQGQRAI